jgi:hypothetical protein
MHRTIKPLDKVIRANLSNIAIALALISLPFGISGAFGVPSQTASTGPATVQSIAAVPGRRIPESQNPALHARLNKALTNTNVNASNSVEGYYNWSGYAATGTSSFNEAQSTFIQPTVTCPVAGAWTLFWVGFDGFNNNTVEQAGTAAQCSTGNKSQPIYYAWWEMYPTNTIQMMPITIKPGNTIQATVSYTASNANYSLNVTDLSNRQQYTTLTRCAANLTCARQSAEWIVERPTLNGSYTPLADWGTMNLTNNKASNTTTTNRRNRVVSNVLQPITAFSNTPISMVNYPFTGETLASVGNLNRSGTLFADNWQAAQ